MNFAELIHPISIDVFFDEYYEKKHLHIKRDNPKYYHSLISPEELDAYFQLKSTYSPHAKMAIDGKSISASKFCIEEIDLGAQSVDSDKMLELFKLGHTIKYDYLHRTYPPLAKKISFLEQELGFVIRTSVYVTPPNSQGYGMHVDKHDVLALQINGLKLWKVKPSKDYLPSIYNVTNEVDWEKTDDIEIIELKAGDFFYCPRGLAHDVYTKDNSSTHFTIGFKPVYGYNLFKKLSDIAYSTNFFKKAIPNKFSSKNSIEDYKEEFKNEFNNLINNLDIDQLIQLDKYNKKQLNFNSGKFLAHFYEPSSEDFYTLSNKNWKFSTDSKFAIQLKYDKNSYNFPINTIELFEFIFDRKEFSIEQLQTLLPNEIQTKIIKKLIKIQFINRR